MISGLFGELWSDARSASPERRVLMASTVGLAVLAAASAGVTHPIVLSAVLGFAAVAAFQPASNAGLVVITLVVVRWLATTADPLTPLAIAMSLELLAFHLTLAVMAATPVSTWVPPPVARTWVVRFAAVGATAPATWMLAAWFDGLEAPASTALTAGALVALAVGAVAVHARTDASG